MNNLSTEKSKTLLAGALLALILVVLFWPVFFQGKVLVPGDIPNTDPFFSRPGIQAPQPQNPLLADQIEQFYVWHSLAAAKLQQGGSVPLWNPYIYTGQPLVANAQSSLFYPPNLLLRFLSPGKVATIRVLFNFLCAGLFTFLFCRELKLSNRAAFLSAVTFAFSGPLMVWVGYPLANVFVCLPFLMWCGERLLRRVDPLRVALLGLGVGVSLLGGHPETTFQILAVFSLYFLARLIFPEEEGRGKGRILLGYLLAVLLGFLVSAVQIAPFLDFMQQSSTFARGGRGGHGGGSLFYSPQWLADLGTAFTLVCPNFFGNPVDYNYIWPSSLYQNYNEQSLYFGLVPLALACGALFAGPRRRPLLIVAALAGFCLTVAWHLPGFEAVNHLPIFSMAPNKRLKLPFVFMTAVMAGYGFDALLRQLGGGRERRKVVYANAAVLLLALGVFVWILALRLTIGPSVPAESFRHELLYNVFSSARWRTFLPLWVAVTAAAGYLLARRFEPLRRHFPALLIALTLTELVGLGWGYNPAVSESEILPAAPAVEFLKKEREPFRILSTDGFFYPNFCAVYGIADVAGYDVPVYQRFSDLYLGQGGRSIGEQIDCRQQWEPQWPLVDFLNVKYVVSPRDLHDGRYKEVYRVAPLKVYENLQVLPRAFMVYHSELIRDRRALLDRVVKGGMDFRNSVLLEEALPGGSLSQGQGRSSVQRSSDSGDRVVWQVTSDRGGMLVTSELFTPDWQVTVDGRQEKLYRANYTYRAVRVPEGSHTVIFSYAPLSYKIGWWLSVAGLALVAGAVAVTLAGGKRNAAIKEESQQ